MLGYSLEDSAHDRIDLDRVRSHPCLRQERARPRSRRPRQREGTASAPQPRHHDRPARRGCRRHRQDQCQRRQVAEEEEVRQAVARRHPVPILTNAEMQRSDRGFRFIQNSPTYPSLYTFCKGPKNIV